MSDILAYVTAVFNWLFVTTTGTNAHTAAIVQLIDLITGQPYLMIGLALMISGAVVSYLSRLIRNT